MCLVILSNRNFIKSNRFFAARSGILNTEYGEILPAFAGIGGGINLEQDANRYAVQMKGISKYFGSFCALDQVDLEVQKAPSTPLLGKMERVNPP